MVWKRGKQMTCFNESVVRSNTHARRLEHQFTWFHSAKVSWQNHYSRIRICIKMALGKCKLNRISNVRKWRTESRQRSEQIQRFARAHTHTFNGPKTYCSDALLQNSIANVPIKMLWAMALKNNRDTNTRTHLLPDRSNFIFYKIEDYIEDCNLYGTQIYIAIACNVIALWCNGMFGKQ